MSDEYSSRPLPDPVRRTIDIGAVNYPSYFLLLERREQDIVRSVVARLIEFDSAVGIVWGGSTSRLTVPEQLADVDLWLLVRDGAEQEAKKDLIRSSAAFKDVVFVLDAGRFAFFGDLVSLFFFPSCAFGVDVGICTQQMLQTATPGERAALVWGAWPDLQYVPRNGPPAEMRLATILGNLVKVRKALLRGYFWNAIEYTARARRELMGLLVGDGPMKEIRYSRPDHSVEAVMSKEDLAALSFTCPQYSRPHIAACASRVGQMSIQWTEEQGLVWAPLSELKLVTESIQATMTVADDCSIWSRKR